MNIWNLTKLFTRMFALKATPSEVPFSITLLSFLAGIFLISKAAAYLWFVRIVNNYDTQQIMHLSVWGSLIVVAMWLLILFASVRSLLSYYKLQERTVQVVTSFIAMDCFLTILFILWLFALSVVKLPLATGSLGSFSIVLGFILLMYWQFMVYIHILINSVNISIIKAGVFALFYQLFQHNVAEIVMNFIIKA